MSCSTSARSIRAGVGCLALLAALAGCGDLPRPFMGQPGRMAERLLQPPPARLAVPVPSNALLTDKAAAAYEEAIVAALQDQEVPAVADVARTGDWRLTATAEVRGETVVPTFSVEDPGGQVKGSAEAPSVDAAEWANGNDTTLKAAALAGAPTIASLLTRIEAQRRMSDPNSLLNRPAKVMVEPVTGAPGDGNYQLARQMKLQLPQQGEQVQEGAAGADFILACDVKTAPGSGNTERIEIQWIVRDAQARELGRVVQLNEVTPGSLDHYWGETAQVVAQEAAGGVREVIINQLGARADSKAAAKPNPAQPASAQPASAQPAPAQPAPVKPSP